MNEVVRVVITRIPRWSYHQWFLLGLFQMREKKEINLSFRVDIFTKISILFSNKLICKIAKKLHSKLCSDSYNLEGYILISGNKRFFCIDSADAPYTFDSLLLNKVCLYFKMQCPIGFKAEGFYLTDEICIPWCDSAHVDNNLCLTDRGERKICNNLFENITKIKAAMLGTVNLVNYSNSFYLLQKAYDNCLQNANKFQSNKLMCYFGNAKGPKPSENIFRPDYDWEADIVGWFKNFINHPNEKRAIAAEILNKLNDNYDARIINIDHADSGITENRENLVIPLESFFSHVAKFEYNLNISGYRMSLPSRFVESFMVGTAIVTDKLRVKWYRPFNKEVIETVEMGYLPNEEVDWAKFRADIITLPKVSKETVLKSFNENWSPISFARYIVNSLTLINQ